MKKRRNIDTYDRKFNNFPDILVLKTVTEKITLKKVNKRQSILCRETIHKQNKKEKE